MKKSNKISIGEKIIAIVLSFCCAVGILYISVWLIKKTYILLTFNYRLEALEEAKIEKGNEIDESTVCIEDSRAKSYLRCYSFNQILDRIDKLENKVGTPASTTTF